MQQKWDQRTLGRQRSTSLGPGPALVLQRTLPWPYNTTNPTWPLYQLYFYILCNKNGIKGLWGQKGQPLLGLGPASVLQWPLPWPNNTPDMVLCIMAIFLHFTQQKWDQVECNKHIYMCRRLRIRIYYSYLSNLAQTLGMYIKLGFTRLNVVKRY